MGASGEELHEVLGIDLEGRRSNLHGLLSGQATRRG
jgi:hypothetical protein